MSHARATPHCTAGTKFSVLRAGPLLPLPWLLPRCCGHARGTSSGSAYALRTNPEGARGAAAQLCQAAERSSCVCTGLGSAEQGGAAEPAAKKPRRLTKRAAAQPEARSKRRPAAKAKTAQAVAALAVQRSTRARQPPRALESFQGGSASD